MNKDIIKYHATVTRQRREALNQHKAVAIWFTGLSGSGKSTLAHALEEKLHRMKCRTYVYDGDNVRHGLCSDLGFNDEDRTENIRRIGEIVKLSVDAGLITMAAFISPIKKDRDRVRSLFAPGDFIEVYCQCSLETCEERDVKGLYQRARQGEIANFTGISSAYDEPSSAELIINTDSLAVDEGVEKIIFLLKSKGILLS